MALPNRVLAIPNVDKKHNEEWTRKRLSRDIGNWPNPNRFIITGQPGAGKSTLCKNLILHQKPPFERVVLIHADAYKTKEYDDLGVSIKLDEIPPVEYFAFEGEPYRKTAVIIDDLEFSCCSPERLRNIGALFRYVSTHKAISPYLMHQNFSDIPSIVRRMASVYICYPPRARYDLSLLENRVGVEKGTLAHLFKKYARKKTDSITVDCSNLSPYRYRLNVWEPIKAPRADKRRKRKHKSKNANDA